MDITKLRAAGPRNAAVLSQCLPTSADYPRHAIRFGLASQERQQQLGQQQQQQQQQQQRSLSSPPLPERKPYPARQIPRELDPLRMPEHVAIIMDGNSRWAKRRGMPTDRGHEAGVDALREVVGLASSWGIKVLTVFAFSTENWHRPMVEVHFLMQLFERVITEDFMNIFTKGICVHFMGDLSRLPVTLRTLASQIEDRTRLNKGLKLVVGLNYSGRQDLVQACKALIAEVQSGGVGVDEIDESKVERSLLTAWDGETGDPDLLIRTSGEKRLSNFMLWQLAYTELVFVPELWPDFGENQFRAALAEYQERNRRFGRHEKV